jgi:hypothetical protein
LQPRRRARQHRKPLPPRIMLSERGFVHKSQ